MITPASVSKPSISTRMALRSARARRGRRESGRALAADSVDLVEEDDAGRGFACLLEEVAHRGLAPTPTNISTKSLPLIAKNGTLASPAMALASSVLPVPARHQQHAARHAAAEPRERLGSLRKAMISVTSSLASSTPATRSKVTLAWSGVIIFTRLRPKDMIPPLPPAALSWLRRKNANSPSRKIHGTT